MTFMSAMINAQEAAAHFRLTLETDEGHRVYRLNPSLGITSITLLAKSADELIELADLLSVAAEQWADQS
jgi:hypothetical protein